MTKRILVVEDEEDSRKILRDLLSTAAYDNYRWPTYMAREVAQHGEKFFKKCVAPLRVKTRRSPALIVQ